MSSRKTELSWAVLSLIVLIVVPFAQIYRHDFVNFDDNLYVVDNPMVHGGLGWDGLRWAFTSTEFSNWFPLTWLSFMFDHELYGLNASGYHLTNLALHVLDALLLFVVLRRMTGATWRSWLVAALFGVHPLHVESVAWVAERKDVLSTLFGLLSLRAYVQYVEKQKASSYVLTVVALAASLMAKPMFVTFPFLLLLLDHWPLGRLPLRDAGAFRRRVWEKTPLFVLVAVSSAVTYVVQAGGGTVQQLATLPLGLRIGNALSAYVWYLEKLVWPRDLAVLYPHAGTELEMGRVLASAALLLAVSALAVWKMRSRPYLLVGWLWYLGTLVPVVGIVQVGIQAVADRYSYFPVVGLFVIVSWGGFDLAARWRHRRAALTAASAAILATFTVITGMQVAHWRDSVTLFEHTLEVTSNNFMVHNNLGYSLAQQGRSAEAIPHFRSALALRPDFADAHNNLGLALDKQGRPGEAVEHFELALALRPGDADVHNSLGIALGKQGRIQEAAVHFEVALSIRPDFGDAHNNLGICLANQGRLAEAIAHFQRALQIEPGAADTYENLMRALAMQGDAEGTAAD